MITSVDSKYTGTWVSIQITASDRVQHLLSKHLEDPNRPTRGLFFREMAGLRMLVVDCSYSATAQITPGSVGTMFHWMSIKVRGTASSALVPHVFEIPQRISFSVVLAENRRVSEFPIVELSAAAHLDRTNANRDAWYFVEA